jgi:hypothetical protein
VALATVLVLNASQANFVTVVFVKAINVDLKKHSVQMILLLNVETCKPIPQIVVLAHTIVTLRLLLDLSVQVEHVNVQTMKK